MRDRLPYPEHCSQTFDQWCEQHGVTDDEYEALMVYWIALRLRASGLLSIMMYGRGRAR
jgi:hypothetical protein